MLLPTKVLIAFSSVVAVGVGVTYYLVVPPTSSEDIGIAECDDAIRAWTKVLADDPTGKSNPLAKEILSGQKAKRAEWKSLNLSEEGRRKARESCRRDWEWFTPAAMAKRAADNQRQWDQYKAAREAVANHTQAVGAPWPKDFTETSCGEWCDDMLDSQRLQAAHSVVEDLRRTSDAEKNGQKIPILRATDYVSMVQSMTSDCKASPRTGALLIAIHAASQIIDKAKARTQ